MKRVIVGRLSDLAEGKLTPSRLGSAPILLTLVDGRPIAFARRCPHQGADLEAGKVVGLVSAEEGCLVADPSCPVLRCPWHGFEFDLLTGDPVVAAPDHRPMRLRRFDVTVRGDELFIER
ncbi:MAG: Rieske 2Fe-2S domain-containing protein [Pseudomonadota bacterium]